MLIPLSVIPPIGGNIIAWANDNINTINSDTSVEDWNFSGFFEEHKVDINGYDLSASSGGMLAIGDSSSSAKINASGFFTNSSTIVNADNSQNYMKFSPVVSGNKLIIKYRSNKIHFL